MSRRKIFDLGSGYKGANYTFDLLVDDDDAVSWNTLAAYVAGATGIPRRFFGEDDPMPRFAAPPGSYGVPRPRSGAKRIEDDPDLPFGTVAFTRGSGTYGARLRLKALGGRWDPDLLGGVWIVPGDKADEAEANIRLAERSGQELPLDTVAGEKVEKITCYVCGKRYSAFEMRTLKGAVVEDWFCGCSERAAGPPPRTARVRTR